MPTPTDFSLFYENEKELAQVFGVSHLYTLKRPEFHAASVADEQFFYLLPSYGTLSSFIPNSKNHRDPTESTISAITSFFKSAYYLPYPERINDKTLLVQSISEILEHQGLTRLSKVSFSTNEKVSRDIGPGWLRGHYYCYYFDFNTALKKHEVKGCLLNILESADYSYDAIMISGFSSKNRLDEAMISIFSNSEFPKKSFWERYRSYKSIQKYDLDKTLFYWTGTIAFEPDYVKGTFFRSHFARKQELSFFLFSVDQSSYNRCNGAVGTQIISPDGNFEIKTTKFLISQYSLNWNIVEEYFEDRKNQTFLTKSDDSTFLKLIQLEELSKNS